MAVRINDYVTAGELRNTTRNSICGWIEFAPDYGVRIELSGNLKGQFEGKHFKFRVPKPDRERTAIEDLPAFVASLANQQIGTIGDVLFREVKVPTVPTAEFYKRSESGEPVPCDIKDCLYLEWFSQNGRVVAEILDPEIEFVSDEPDGTETLVAEPLIGSNDTDEDGNQGASGLSITRIEIADDGTTTTEELTFAREDEAVEDEFQLFDKDLAQQIQRSLADLNPPGAASPEQASGLWPDDLADDFPSGLADSSSNDLINSDAAQPRSWEEVVPGIDPETKALYESWDEIYGGKNEEPVSTLFDPPLQLPPAETISADEAAEPVLKMILARLAELNVAIDMCEHCTPLSAYRMLVNEILPIAYVHPNLAATDIVQHYCAYEFCPRCAAEFEAECE